MQGKLIQRNEALRARIRALEEKAGKKTDGKVDKKGFKDGL